MSRAFFVVPVPFGNPLNRLLYMRTPPPRATFVCWLSLVTCAAQCCCPSAHISYRNVPTVQYTLALAADAPPKNHSSIRSFTPRSRPLSSTVPQLKHHPPSITFALLTTTNSVNSCFVLLSTYIHHLYYCSSLSVKQCVTAFVITNSNTRLFFVPPWSCRVLAAQSSTQQRMPRG